MPFSSRWMLATANSDRSERGRLRRLRRFSLRSVALKARARLLVIDDNDIFRAGLCSYLRSQADLDVVGEASGGRSGVQLARKLHPDAVLIDLRMPELSGVDAIRLIAQRDRTVRIVALTMLADRQSVEAALRAGACGHLLKYSPMTDFVAAVRAAARGNAWISAGAAGELLDDLTRERTTGLAEVGNSLNHQEMDVLRLLARNHQNGELAQELGISSQTADSHVTSILAKAGVAENGRAPHAAVFSIHASRSAGVMTTAP